jgi:hypothetical protein
MPYKHNDDPPDLTLPLGGIVLFVREISDAADNGFDIRSGQLSS